MSKYSPLVFNNLLSSKKEISRTNSFFQINHYSSSSVFVAGGAFVVLTTFTLKEDVGTSFQLPFFGLVLLNTRDPGTMRDDPSYITHALSFGFFVIFRKVETR